MIELSRYRIFCSPRVMAGSTTRKRIRTQRRSSRRRSRGKAAKKDLVNAIIGFYQPTGVQRKELRRLVKNFPRFVKVVRDEPQLLNIHIKANYQRTADFLLDELERIKRAGSSYS